MPEAGYIIQQIAISIIPIMFAVILHEISHGYAALKLGDPTAKMLGRLTLNPVSHIDIFGTIIMPLALYVLTDGKFVFGYAKPVPINPNNFRNPNRDMAISSLAGPATNLILAAISVILLKHALVPLATGMDLDASTMKTFFEPLGRMLVVSVSINVVLAVFNMIPIPPLDGGRVLRGFLPYRQAEMLDKIEPYGIIIVMLLVITHISDFIIYPVIRFIIGVLSML
jgi:Zn-dependent protease